MRTPSSHDIPSRPSSRRAIVTLSALVACAGTVGSALGQGYVPPPASNIASVLDFGAVPNDGQDDLASFQGALDVLVGTGRILYVPDGVYNFSGRLNWGGVRSGGFFTLQGQSRGGTILRLDASASGFSDTANPRVFIDAYEGNSANQFRTYLRDLTIEVGANNPGAIGLEFQSNNTGRIENVTIRSIDPDRRGKTGLQQGFNFPGPMLLRNITIEGFDEGYVGAPQEYSVVFENLTLRNQRVLGMYVWRLPLQIRNLVSENSVPVLRNDSNPGAWGHVVIDGATLGPGLASPSPTTDAIINSNSAGVIVLRNITTTGYRNAVRDESFSVTTPITVPNGLVTQFTTDAPVAPGASPSTIVAIPVEETPEPPSIPVAQWVSVKSFGAIENDNLDDTLAVQAALRSGAPVVYFPSGNYIISDTLEPGPNVQRIEGLMSDISTNAPLATENKPLLRITPGSPQVVHISGLNASFQSPGFIGGGVLIEQAVANTLVVRDGDLSYRNTVPGGKVFLENLVGTNMTFTGQRVWARQLNPEGSDFTHVTNDAGDLYVLGLKTEGSSTVLENRNRARAAIMGGLVYPSTVIADRTRPMVINTESALSFSMPESCYITDGSYAVWVRETRNGVVSDFTRAMLPLGRGHSVCGGQIALYTSSIADATAPSVPATPTVVSTSLDAIQLSWPASTDAQSGIARYNIYRDGAFYRSVEAGASPMLIDAGQPDGTTFDYRVSAVNGNGIESAQSGMRSAATLADAESPRLLGVRSGLDARFATLLFSEPLDPASANVAANYTISGPTSVQVLSAALAEDARSVLLTLSGMATGVQTLTVSNVADRATNPNTIAPGFTTAFNFTSAAAAPSGTGLSATYWNNREFLGSPLLTRIDPQIAFIYGLNSPAPGVVPADNFAVRWSGQLRPRFTEPYTITIRSDDGARVFIDGVLVAGRWVDQGPTNSSVTIPLDSSRTHDLVVEYYEAGFGAEVTLSWQSASQPFEAIPQSCLFPTRRLTTVRTFDGAGADVNLARFSSDDGGAGQSFGAFHSPASGGFHQAGLYRLDLAALDLANNYIEDATATLTQTFFGIGDGKRLINFFGVRQAPGSDSWIETGPGHVTWDTAPGNNGFGAITNPATSSWLATYLLDNTGFQNNNQYDRTFFRGQRLFDFINADTDGRVSILAKRYDASNEGQSWFTKEWGIPGAAPALKVTLAPRCPQAEAPTSLSITDGGSMLLTSVVRGKPPLSIQWLRDGQPIANGPSGAAPGGGEVFGAVATLTQAPAGQEQRASLIITGATAADAGAYSVRVTNACSAVTSATASLTVTGGGDPCNYDFNQDENVDLTDAQLMAQVAAGVITPDPSWLSGDLNGDENADLTDAQQLAAFVASGVCPI